MADACWCAVAHECDSLMVANMCLSATSVIIEWISFWQFCYEIFNYFSSAWLLDGQNAQMMIYQDVRQDVRCGGPTFVTFCIPISIISIPGYPGPTLPASSMTLALRPYPTRRSKPFDIQFLLMLGDFAAVGETLTFGISMRVRCFLCSCVFWELMKGFDTVGW